MHIGQIFTVKTASRILASLALCLVVSVIANAQQTPPGTTAPTSPIQIVSNAQFNQMVQSGQLKVATPGVVLIQNLERLFTDFKNQLMVSDFLFHNPNLTDLQQLVRLTPTSQNVSPTLDGNYRTLFTNSNGISETIETMGQGTKLGSVADSIRASTDPVRQLAIYQSAFSQYSALYNQICAPSPIGTVGDNVAPQDTISNNCPNLVAPSSLTPPSALQDSTLGVIQTALQTLGTQGIGILHSVPFPIGIVTGGCSAEVGASSTAGVNAFYGFGDQTQSTGFTLSPNGVVANFNFPNKNLLGCIRNQGQRGSCHIFAATSAIEELIARDTGLLVNLSEQDFMENLKLAWAPSYYNDNGDGGFDLQQAATNNYKFTYENQWDYNPSLEQPGTPAFEYQNTCANYPYPSLEAGCSDSAPQGIEFCTITSSFAGILHVCGFTGVTLSGSSPYYSMGANNIWNPANKDLSVDYIYLALAFNNAVILGFNVTNNFEYGSPGGFTGYSAADNLTSLGQHFVHIVGFVGNSDLAGNPNTASATPGSGGGYFIIKNSWGASYGDAGYEYMPVDYLKANAVDVFVVSDVGH